MDTLTTAADPTDAFTSKVKDWCEDFQYLFESQAARNAKITDWWRRHHQDTSLVDKRTDEERKWRHVLMSPRGFVNSEAAACAMGNLITETSPTFVVRGRGVEDLGGEQPIEALIEHELCGINPKAEWVVELFRRANVQGIAFMKSVYSEEWAELNILPRQWEIERFRQRVKMARDMVLQAGGREQDIPFAVAPDGQVQVPDLMGFARWQAFVAQQFGIQVPPPPVARKEKVQRHVGIKLLHIEPFDLIFDRKIANMRDQKRVYQRMVVDKLVLLDYCKRENERAMMAKSPVIPFDLAAIEALPEGVTPGGSWGTMGSVGELQNRILEVLGVNDQPSTHPAMKRAVEIVEVWEPQALDDYRWCWIGQRGVPITQPGYFPFAFPFHPYVAQQNIPSPGQLVGISEYEINAPMHDHLDAMRGTLADYIAMSVYSPFVITNELGGSTSGRKFEVRPFEIIPGEPGERIAPLFNGQAQIDVAQAYMGMLSGEIDFGTGWDDLARGQAAQLNRVTGQEVEIRAKAQQNRPREKMYRFGAMCSADLIPLVVAQLWQFGKPEHILNVAHGDPFDMMASDTLLPAMRANYMFMPAALISEVALQIQQLQQSIELGGKTGLLQQGGDALMLIFQRLLALSRVQGADQIIAAARQDLQKAQEQGQAQGQVEQLQQQLAAVQKENDALRRKMVPPIPPAQELQAEIDALNAATAPPEGQAPPEEGGGEMQAQPPGGPGPAPEEAAA